MAKTKMNPETSSIIAERNLNLLDELMRHLLAEPQVLNCLPENFELVILPDNDPEVRQYNLELLDQYGREGKPIVFARLHTSNTSNLAEVRPHLYVPLTA